MITGGSTKPGTTGSRKTWPRFGTTPTWRQEVKGLRKATGLVRVPPNFRYEGKWGWHQAFRKKWALLFPLKSDGKVSVAIQRQVLLYLADTSNTYSLEVLNTRSNAGIAAKLAISARSVQYAIKALKDQGLVISERTIRDNRQVVNHYWTTLLTTRELLPYIKIDMNAPIEGIQTSVQRGIWI